MKMKKLYYRGTHEYSFRTGQWALVIGTIFKERLCFLIEFPDGQLDYTPVIDIANYELKEEDENI